MIGAGNTSGCIDFQTNEDDVYEEDELLMATLFSTGDAHITINQSIAVLEITDNDGINAAYSYMSTMLIEFSSHLRCYGALVAGRV